MQCFEDCHAIDLIPLVMYHAVMPVAFVCVFVLSLRLFSFSPECLFPTARRWQCHEGSHWRWHASCQDATWVRIRSFKNLSANLVMPFVLEMTHNNYDIPSWLIIGKLIINNLIILNTFATDSLPESCQRNEFSVSRECFGEFREETFSYAEPTSMNRFTIQPQ